MASPDRASSANSRSSSASPCAPTKPTQASAPSSIAPPHSSIRDESQQALGEKALCADLRPYAARSINDRYLRIPAGWSRRRADIANRRWTPRTLLPNDRRDSVRGRLWLRSTHRGRFGLAAWRPSLAVDHAVLENRCRSRVPGRPFRPAVRSARRIGRPCPPPCVRWALAKAPLESAAEVTWIGVAAHR